MTKGKTSDEVRQFNVGLDDDGIRLDRWFKRHLPQIGFATVSRWARTGQIRVDGKRSKPEDRLTAGQQVRVPPGGDAPAVKKRIRKDLTPDDISRVRDMVISEDRAAIVLNKPPGLATQGGTKTHEHVDGLLDAFGGDEDPRPRLVHRLDKDTSGVLLVAKSASSAAFFSKRFAGRSARKIYWALVVGVPDALEGEIDAPLAKQPGTGGEKMWVDEENGQAAKTRYRVIDRAAKRAAWVELYPLTGRTHQLRVHMAAIGHPIVGDGKYGGQDAFLTGSVSRKMHLHARRLIIDHPDGSRLDAMAELPEHFAASMAHLGFEPGMSDASPDEGPPPPPRSVQKQAARQHAKQYRKERRGERRKRADGPTGRTPSGQRAENPGSRAPASKRSDGPAPRGAGKPADRPATRTPGGRRSDGPDTRTPGGRRSDRPDAHAPGGRRSDGPPTRTPGGKRSESAAPRTNGRRSDGPSERSPDARRSARPAPRGSASDRTPKPGTSARTPASRTGPRTGPKPGTPRK